MIEKSPEAFRTISEVAEELDLPQHVLRFWETRFSQIKPLKRGGGRRYYRPEDINLLKGIRHLLYGEGYTIKGVQRILKEQGVRYVAGVWETESQEEVRETQAPQEPLAPEAAYAPPSSAAMAPAAAPPAPAEPSSGPAERPGPVVRADPSEPAPATPPPVSPPAVSASPVSQMPDLAAAPQGLSTEDIRQLKAALFELIECKRILDDARHRA